MINHIEAVRKGKKTFKCQICEKSFSQSAVLWKFIRSQFMKTKNSFKCNICDYSCYGKRDMNNHVGSVHEGKKPFKCKVCDKTFSFKSGMNTHIETVHDGKKKYECVTKDFLVRVTWMSTWFHFMVERKHSYVKHVTDKAISSFIKLVIYCSTAVISSMELMMRMKDLITIGFLRKIECTGYMQKEQTRCIISWRKWWIQM